MSLRKILFWLHLVCGLFAGVVLFIMAGSGALIAYERQLVRASEQRAYSITPAGDVLTPEDLAQKANAARGDLPIASLTVRKDTNFPPIVNFGKDRLLTLNPYTGAALDEGTWVRRTLHEIEHFHRDLGLGETGKNITGLCSLALLGLSLSGLYLWFPKEWAKAILRPRLLRGKARSFNWHNAFGFWASIPLLVSAMTGMVFSYQWANQLLFRIAGSEAPARKEPAKGQPPSLNTVALNSLWQIAQTQYPGWESITFRPSGPGGKLTSILVEWGATPNQRATLTGDSGKLVKTETFESQPTGRQWRMWVKPIHTGEALGLPGQTISFVASLCAMVLVWTGLMLTWIRFKTWRGRNRNLAQGNGNTAAASEPNHS